MNSKGFNNATKLNDIVSVKDFGAKGDGITDDTNAFKNALAGTNKNIHIPAGKYIIRDTLILQDDTNLIGDGKGVLYSPSNGGTTLYWDQAPPLSALKQWTDIGLGQDNLLFAPCIVLGGSSCVIENLNITADDCVTDWAAGIFIPATKQHEINSVKIDGTFSSAGLHIDATWSDRNTTLKTINPTVNPADGPVEIYVQDSYFTGNWSVKIQGTSRDGTGYTVATWPFGYNGTSDIVFTNCQFRPTANLTVPPGASLQGGIFASSKVMFTNGVVSPSRGPKLVACSFRVSSSYIAKFDWSKEIVFVCPMGETQAAYRSAQGSAWFEVSSNTNFAAIIENSIQYCRFAQNGTAEPVSNSYWNAAGKPDIVFSCIDTGRFQTPFFDSNWGTNDRDTFVKGFGTANAIVFSKGSDDTFLGKFYGAGTDAPQLVLNSNGIIRSEDTGSSNNNSQLIFSAGSTPVFYITKPNTSPQFVSYGPVRPDADNNASIGTSTRRWSTVYAATGTINTSDERQKQDIAALDEAEKRVAVALKGLVRKFRFKDAIAAKGDSARIHVGVIAQEVVAAFNAEGLDATRYGLLCYDEWQDEFDENGTVTTPAGSIYGIRYEELLAFIISAI